MQVGPHSMYPRDRAAVRDAKVNRGSLRRAWTFARPYRGTIALFLVAIVVDALLGLIPAFAVRAGLVVAQSLADGALTILQRWCSARVGEGMIYDLRVALFAKVQRMPIAFFTRTQTGALTNDVVGAQTAVTSTLGSVVSNIIVLITTLLAMFALQWQLTLIALIVL